MRASTLTTSTVSTTFSSLPTVSQPPNGTCEARTINYITHSLPQICLRYSRSDTTTLEPPGLSATEASAIETKLVPTSTLKPAADPSSSAEGTARLDLDSESALDESSFLSFKEWKKQTLEKDGFEDTGAGDRRQTAREGERRKGRDGIQDAVKALEEDVAFDTDFTVFLGDRSGDDITKESHMDEEDKTTGSMPQAETDGAVSKDRPRYRGKDAGKTCKERFNFASLDAGGQVMKANPEAKSASALLKEDRDVYMLNTCQAKNKFLVVELSESILVETVAIANFEFFSSTFRQFRISVGDRYPMKPDRWVDLGTFEARNSRDIQAFLVDDPRIWARYLRIEFLTHYGNEFYCPVSLLRVHGRTMIQDVLGMEEAARGEDDSDDYVDDTRVEEGDNLVSDATALILEEEQKIAEGLKEAETAIQELVKTAETVASSTGGDPLDFSHINEAKRWLEDVSTKQMTTPWIRPEPAFGTLFNMSHWSNLCPPSSSPALQATASQDSTIQTKTSSEQGQVYETSTNLDQKVSRPSSVETKQLKGTRNITTSDSTVVVPSNGSSTASSFAQEAHMPTVAQNVTNATGHNKSMMKSSATVTSPNPQPTTQESFFKTVSKRLQLLEANSTLSLKYIEEQSRILRDAFTKVEKKQLAKTTSFLENLNDTVLEELRKFGQQYDQIWQSTVIELETQRDQSQREITAVSMRLSVVADELLFQKRMSIVQSVLLLLCLGLVIFSRIPTGSYLDVPLVHNMASRSRDDLDFPQGSPSSSPTARKVVSMREAGPWSGPEHRRQRSDDSVGSLRSRSQADSPPTPFFTYSRQEEEVRHDLGHEELLKGAHNNATNSSLARQDPSQPLEASLQTSWQADRVIPEEDEPPVKSYPDFRNSSLWLTEDPLLSEDDRDKIQNYVERQTGEDGVGPIYATYGSGNPRAPERDIDEESSELTASLSRLPSPPPEKGKPEFSIARKPLPALPRNGL